MDISDALTQQKYSNRTTTRLGNMKYIIYSWQYAIHNYRHLSDDPCTSLMCELTCHKYSLFTVGKLRKPLRELQRINTRTAGQK